MAVEKHLFSAADYFPTGTFVYRYPIAMLDSRRAEGYLVRGKKVVGFGEFGLVT
jgi:hypothetical protein